MEFGADGSVSGSVQLDGYQRTLVFTFLGQVAFCLGVYWWGQSEESRAEEEYLQQQARQYHTLYQFHTQVENEMVAAKEYAGPSAGGSPGKRE
jgi:hypothetical protein